MARKSDEKYEKLKKEIEEANKRKEEEEKRLEEKSKQPGKGRGGKQFTRAEIKKLKGW
jgi:hypothetical protein